MKKDFEEMFKEDNYEIKTTSFDILKKFEKEKEKKKSKKKKFFGIFIPSLTFVLASSILALVLIPRNSVTPGNKKDEEIIIPPVDTVYSFNDLSSAYQDTIKDELLAILNFNDLIKEESSLSNLTSLKLNSLNLKSENNVSLYEDMIYLYDEFTTSIFNLLNNNEINITSSTTEEEYKNLLTFYNDISKYEISYNLNDFKEDNFLIEGILKTNEGEFPITIKKETELEENEKESEIETIIKYSSSKIVKIQKEEEIEKDETQNTYSYSIYSSESSLNKDNYDLKFEYEIEIEEKESEKEISISKKDEELEIGILSHTESSIEFEFEYIKNNKELEDLTCFHEIKENIHYYTIKDESNKTLYQKAI